MPPEPEHAPAVPAPAPRMPSALPAPSGSGLAGLASALGNQGFAAVARQTRPQPMGPIAIDEPEPLLGMTGHQALRNAVIPTFEAADAALAAPKPTRGQIDTAHANVRQGAVLFRSLRTGASDVDHPSQLDHALAELAVRQAELRMDAIAAGNGYAVATQGLVRALAAARRGRANAEQRDGHGGKLRPPDATTPTPADFERDAAEIETAMRALATFGPGISPADAETLWFHLETLIPYSPRDADREAVANEVDRAREGMALVMLGLERAVEGARKRMKEAAERLEKLAVTEERVARRRAGERDPIPDDQNPEIPHEPEPPPPDEWI